MRGYHRPVTRSIGISPDPLIEIIRGRARKLIEQAVEAELALLLAAFANHKLEDGRTRLVRHGHLPEREVLTGIGPVTVKVPRVRDRKPGEDRIVFTPSILPRYLRRTQSVEEVLPWLSLKGVSSGDFSEALAAVGHWGTIGSSPMDDGPRTPRAYLPRPSYD